MKEERAATVVDHNAAPSERPTWRPSGVQRSAIRRTQLLGRLASHCDASDPAELLGAVLMLNGSVKWKGHLDARAQWVLPYVDGDRTVDDVVVHSGLPRVDAMFGVSELLTHHIVSLR